MLTVYKYDLLHETAMGTSSSLAEPSSFIGVINEYRRDRPYESAPLFA